MLRQHRTIKAAALCGKVILHFPFSILNLMKLCYNQMYHYNIRKEAIMDTENPKTAIEYIHSLGRFSGKPGLHRIKALCEALGNPQDRLKFVHLAGTNGKGSTACMIASALQAAGLRTGLYTSPYLVQFYERIRVDGVMISDDDLTRLCERVTVACESLALPEGETIGEFEFTTALAFLCFVEQECDIVVLETGLGGRCDATNVIQNAEVCVITPISLDHMAVLGNTTAVIRPRRQVFSSRVRRLSARTVSRMMYSGCCAVPVMRRVLSGSAERRTAACCGAISAVRRSCMRDRATPLPCPDGISCRMRGRLCGR